MKDRSKKRKPPRDPERGKERSFRWYRNHSHEFEFCPPPAFFELADAMVQERRTRFGYDRFYVLIWARGPNNCSC